MHKVIILTHLNLSSLRTDRSDAGYVPIPFQDLPKKVASSNPYETDTKCINQQKKMKIKLGLK